MSVPSHDEGDQVDTSDAHWFPVDLHVPGRTFGFLRLDASLLEETVFLDTRMAIPLADARPVPVATVAGHVSADANLGWLFHTSFCCSTLLARALHLPPVAVALKEPLVLRRLADARYSGWPLDGLLGPTVNLLARPWNPGGTVVVKPTHAALNIASDLLAASPKSRGIVLTSSVEDFVVSNLKKTAETRLKIPALVERALRVGGFAARLPETALRPPDLSAAATLQWAAQREICVDVLEHAGGRLRVLDASALLADVVGVAGRCATWLSLPMAPEVVAVRAGQVSGHNAKAVAHRYDPDRRARDAAGLREANGVEIARALDWFARNVAPAMRRSALALEDAFPAP